jgi:predicted transposase YbfD/YdcC
MDAKATEVFLRFFTALKDHRRPNVRHLFTDILTIAILGIMCKADDWVEVRSWAQANGPWLSTFLALPKGIPSADTFRRVFMKIDPVEFEHCFVAWTTALAEATLGKLIAIDGKSLRRSFAHAWDKQMMHLVSAWSVQNQIVLAQLATDKKSNEITAIPKLLGLLDLKGAVVTIDAIGCQTEIAAKIKDKGGDYVLAVKDNQPALSDKTRKLLDEAILDKFAGMSHDFHQETNSGHGRIETRNTWVTDEIQWLGQDLLDQWPALSSIVVVESHRQVLGDKKGKVTTHRRYYISSLKGCDAKQMAKVVRGHWGVENQLHWRLDMTFREDESRLNRGHGAENFSRLRRIVINKLRAVQGEMSLKTTRYRCSIDRDFLLKALSQ